MNKFREFVQRLSEQISGVRVELSEPAEVDGVWFADVSRDAKPVIVEWRARRGFGVSTPSEDAYGARPDEFYTDADAALARVKELIESNARTEPASQRSVAPRTA